MSQITQTAQHYYGHGEAWLFSRTAGGVAAAGSADAISLPEIDSLEISLATEKVERTSKRNAMASKNVSIVKMVSATFKLVCSQHVATLLAVYLFGTKSTIAGGAVSAVAFVTGLVVGDIMPFPGDRVNFSTFTSIVDSAGSPATLVNGTDYEVDEKAGVIKILNLGSYTQPLKVTGVESAGTGIGLMMSRQQEKMLRFKGINIANSDAVEVVDLYRAQIDPAASWTLLNDGSDPNKYEISGQLLIDSTKSTSATFGQYGRLRQ
jgi:hypothetical protein